MRSFTDKSVSMSKIRQRHRSKSKRKQQELYLSVNRYDKNKEAKALRHLAKHPNDKSQPGDVPNYKVNKKKRNQRKFHMKIEKAKLIEQGRLVG